MTLMVQSTTVTHLSQYVRTLTTGMLLFIFLLVLPSASSFKVSRSVSTDLESGRSNQLSTNSMELIRWTNVFTQISYTEEQYDDSYISEPFGMGLQEGGSYNIQGETSLGTPFMLRMKIKDLSMKYEAKIKYAAPILSGSVVKRAQMMWDGCDDHKLCDCAECNWHMPNYQYEYFECLLAKRQSGNCLSANDLHCTNAPYTDQSVCLNKFRGEWWFKPWLTGEARWGYYSLNFVDHAIFKNCHSGGCTPPGFVYSFQQGWEPSGDYNIVYIVELSDDPIIKYNITIDNIGGIDGFEGCTLTEEHTVCDFGDGYSKIYVDNIQPPAFDQHLAVNVKCNNIGCSFISAKRWIEGGTISDDFPLLKYDGTYPGPGCAMSATSPVFKPKTAVGSVDGLFGYYSDNRVTNGVYHVSDSGGHPCGDRYLVVKQSIEEFSMRTDDLLYCGVKGGTMIGYHEVDIPISASYTGSECDRFINKGCYYTGADLHLDNCNSGQIIFFGQYKSSEIAVKPPDGVNIGACTTSVSGFYGMDDAAVLHIKACKSAGPVQLTIITADVSFSGGLASVYATLDQVTVYEVAITVPYNIPTITIREVYSNSERAISAELGDASEAFPPDISEGGSNSSGGFYNFTSSVFGKFFFSLLIIFATIILLAIFSCCYRANKAKTVKTKTA